MPLHSPMKSLTCLGILLAAAAADGPAVDPFLLPSPSDKVFNIHLETTGNPCTAAAHTACDTLRTCLAKLKDSKLPYRLKMEKDLLTGDQSPLTEKNFPFLKLDGKKPILCGIDFEVEEIKFDQLSSCVGEYLPVKVISAGTTLATKVNDKVLGTAFGTSNTALSFLVGTPLLDGVNAYYVNTTGAKCKATNTYGATVVWTATFGSDSQPAAFPILGNVINMTLDSTPECSADRTKELNTALSVKDMTSLRTVADKVLGWNTPDCFARLTTRLSPSTPLKTSSLLVDAVQKKGFGFRIIGGLRMTLTALEFDSNPKCKVSKIYTSTKLSQKLTSRSSFASSRPNRLQLSTPLQLTENDLIIFLSGCETPATLSAELQLRPKATVIAEDDKKVQIWKKISPDGLVSDTTKPTVKPSQSCGAITECKGEVADLPKCFEAADKKKDCKLDLTWKGKAVVDKSLKRIVDLGLGIGVGFSISLPTHENISKSILKDFIISGLKLESWIPDGSPVSCDSGESPRVVGKVAKMTDKFNATFEEPIPLDSAGIASCFVPFQGPKTDVANLSIEWDVVGEFAARKDARNLIPIEFQVAALDGNQCPIDSIPDTFFSQTVLEKFKNDQLVGCKGSEEVTLVSARSYNLSAFSTKKFPVVKVDPKLFPAGNGSWNLKAWTVEGVNATTCYVPNSVLSEVTENADGSLAKGPAVFTFTAAGDTFGDTIYFDPPIVLKKDEVVLLAFLGNDCAVGKDTVQPSIVISRPFEVKAKVTNTSTLKPGDTPTGATHPADATTSKTSTASFSPFHLVPFAASLFFVFA